MVGARVYHRAEVDLVAVKGNTIRSTYSLKQVKRCENGGKELMRRSDKIRKLVTSSQ